MNYNQQTKGKKINKYEKKTEREQVKLESFSFWVEERYRVLGKKISKRKC